MTKIIAILGFCLVVLLTWMAIRFEDKEAAGYLTKIRFLGTAILILIGSIALWITDKQFCELFPFFCR